MFYRLWFFLTTLYPRGERDDTIWIVLGLNPARLALAREETLFERVLYPLCHGLSSFILKLQQIEHYIKPKRYLSTGSESWARGCGWTGHRTTRGRSWPWWRCSSWSGRRWLSTAAPLSWPSSFATWKTSSKDNFENDAKMFVFYLNKSTDFRNFQ